MKTIDSMNTTMGQDTIRFAAQGIDHPWARKCENRTPRYTTNWDELVKVQRELASRLVETGAGLILPGDADWNDPPSGKDDVESVKVRAIT